MVARARGFADPRVVDAAVAVVLGVVAEIGVFVGSGWRGPVALNAVCVAAVAASLWWRRFLPLAVLAFTLIVFSGLALAYGSSDSPTGFFLLIVVAYSAGAYALNPWVAGVLLAVLAAVHDLRERQVMSFGDAVYLFAVLGLVFLFGLGMRARQARTAEVERERDTVAELAVEDERRRIARELHDIISHSLGVLVLQAGAAEQVLERDPPRAREVLRSIRATGQEAIAEMGTLLSLAGSEAESSRQSQPSLARPAASENPAGGAEGRARGGGGTVRAAGTARAVGIPDRSRRADERAQALRPTRPRRWSSATARKSSRSRCSMMAPDR